MWTAYYIYIYIKSRSSSFFNSFRKTGCFRSIFVASLTISTYLSLSISQVTFQVFSHLRDRDDSFRKRFFFITLHKQKLQRTKRISIAERIVTRVLRKFYNYVPFFFNHFHFRTSYTLATYAHSGKILYTTGDQLNPYCNYTFARVSWVKRASRILLLEKSKKGEGMLVSISKGEVERGFIREGGGRTEAEIPEI